MIRKSSLSIPSRLFKKANNAGSLRSSLVGFSFAFAIFVCCNYTVLRGFVNLRITTSWELFRSIFVNSLTGPKVSRNPQDLNASELRDQPPKRRCCFAFYSPSRGLHHCVDFCLREVFALKLKEQIHRKLGDMLSGLSISIKKLEKFL